MTDLYGRPINESTLIMLLVIATVAFVWQVVAMWIKGGK